MNLPNRVTLARIFLVPIFLVFLLVRVIPYGQLVAAFIFVLAASTDGLDGYLARKHKKVTTLGKIIDPLADKLLITSALVSLVSLGELHAVLAIIIISREFAVSGLRVVAAAEGHDISASRLGKWKTVLQIIAVAAIIVDAAGKRQVSYIPLFTPLVTFFPTTIFANLMLAVAVFLTVWSGVDYFYRNRRIIKKT